MWNELKIQMRYGLLFSKCDFKTRQIMFYCERGTIFTLLLEKRGKDIVIFFLILIVITEYYNNIFKDRRRNKRK